MMLVLVLGVHSYFGCWPPDKKWIRGILAGSYSCRCAARDEAFAHSPFAGLGDQINIVSRGAYRELMLFGLNLEDLG
jgi:hypothetical protein